MHKLEELLNKVSRKSDALRVAEALYSCQLAPDFNTFNYIKTDELGISKILADLLDPKGTHGQKELFLQLFIQHSMIDIKKDENWQAFIKNADKTKVSTEVLTEASGTRRRMDIYLEGVVHGKKYGICIENKPYASDQVGQIKDYALELTNRAVDHWHIVYLSEYRELPSESSITAEDLSSLISENKFTSLRFRSLIEWLKACRLECQNNDVSIFLRQFIAFIQKQFMGIENMSKSNAVLEIMKQDTSSIEASLMVQNNIERMKESLILELINQLIEKNTNPKINIEYSKEHSRHGLITFATVESIGFVCFEFDRPYNNPDLGFRFISEKQRDHEDAPRHIEQFNKKLNDQIHNKVFKSSWWYPAYYSFEPYDLWDTTTKPWEQIINGEMAKKILGEAEQIVEALSEYL
ncbi:PD-(D/E)XK nuclease family protein [Psychrobacter sp. FDAARGOS_221]|uniref:PDDEXK-like family protein n=1 Tax=Psychrobacter sp. FDAARGOS_221 TaxID=1975705 RepID=UPI000BB598F1|nr:PD-(D/E)XK nuclease family protein [Psychrobacter sp. FDAARGOS_221]PNK59675.1 hypothetical protein A6J60_001435 [Psychrobacter sp. FDAARGOS_221]